MAADASAPAALPDGESGSTKIRIRFRKGGDLRFVSHHDLMHCFERMLRRSALPFVSTQGFHPHPRIVFPLSLALGIGGLREVVEIELAGSLTPDEVHCRLAATCPSGLEIDEVRVIERRTRGQVRRATYRLQLPADVNRDELQTNITSFLAAPKHIVQRQRPQPKRLDVRPYLSDLRLSDGCLEMDFWITPNGTARAEEILQALGLEDIMHQGAVLERTELELIDETQGSEPAGAMVAAASDSDDSTLEHLSQESKADSGQPQHRQPTPLFSGPLSFDS